ncbi:DUF6962 family protein [Actinomadura sp. 3N407]|uniref:DUF6962 family protein n=1 Tax=Actinomadura sp. 3N407 TaxID=3457423 RepID=UPI003FCE32C6
MEAITNLILALVAFACALALLRVPGVIRAWHMTFWFAGASALAGAVYHGLFHTTAAWVVVGVLVVIAISYLLIGSGRLALARAFQSPLTYISGFGTTACADDLAAAVASIRDLSMRTSGTAAADNQYVMERE